MGSFKLILILPFLTFAQSKPPEPFITKYNAEVHFYGSCLVNDAAYSLQGLIWPNRTPAKKLLISNAMTLACISSKEFYDTQKKRPTGWGWSDWLVGLWAMAIYTIVRICINDFRKSKQSIKLEP